MPVPIYYAFAITVGVASALFMFYKESRRRQQHTYHGSGRTNTHTKDDWVVSQRKTFEDSARPPGSRRKQSIKSTSVEGSGDELNVERSNRYKTRRNLNECGICLSSLESRAQMTLTLPCQHVFHARCIELHLSINDNCPICKVPSKYNSMDCKKCNKPLSKLDNVNMLPCGHKFHEECLNQFLQYSPKCITCGALFN